MSAPHGSDTEISIFTRLIDHFLVLAIIIALLTRLSGFQMFTNNANLIFSVLDNVRTNKCTFREGNVATASVHRLQLPIRGHGLDTCLREYAIDESHTQSLCALALGHNLILDETRRNISRSPSEYQGEQAPGER